MTPFFQPWVDISYSCLLAVYNEVTTCVNTYFEFPRSSETHFDFELLLNGLILKSPNSSSFQVLHNTNIGTAVGEGLVGQ